MTRMYRLLNNLKKRKYGGQRNFSMNFHRKRFMSGIHRSIRRRTDARSSLTSFTLGVIDSCCWFTVIEKEIRPGKEYLIPSDNIIVLDRHFNLANKCNHIGLLYYNLRRFIDNSAVD